MRTNFKKIGLMGRFERPDVRPTMAKAHELILASGAKCFVETEAAQTLDIECEQISTDEIAKKCDLVVVVGGDGSLLSAARVVVDAKIPVVGINRGRLGFLTDISPGALGQLSALLTGAYETEQRSLLHMEIKRGAESLGSGTALNDIVLYSGDIARMIEFSLHVDGTMVYTQRSDGLITATPTGSTAYALSAGGPILHPGSDCIVMVPMCPHTLSSRPIVLHDDANIALTITENNDHNPRISCDGQVHYTLEPGDQINIRPHAKKLNLLHPRGYDYYDVLRSKLGWTG